MAAGVADGLDADVEGRDDHALILVNGKRRHRAAVITWLGNGIADGSQGSDISVIPSIAIRQARGPAPTVPPPSTAPDAIARIVNFQLKDASEGGPPFRAGAVLAANPGPTRRRAARASSATSSTPATASAGGRAGRTRWPATRGAAPRRERVPERQLRVRTLTRITLPSGKPAKP